MLDVLTLIVGAVGAVGGAAGFLALKMQRDDQERRQRIAHLPPELRPVLLEIAEVAAEVVRTPRDEAWVASHLFPLAKKYRTLAAVVHAADQADSVGFVELRAALVQVSAFALNDRLDVGRIAQHARKQEEAAAECVRLAQELLHRLSGV